MRKIILLVILVALGWKGYEKFGHGLSQAEATREYAFDMDTDHEDASGIDARSSDQSEFTCDGRVYCSQMKSCEEAKYFVQHCPDVKMDGNHDGTPCEKQWCS